MQIKVNYTNYINLLVLLFFVAVVLKRTAMDVVFLSIAFTGLYFAIKEKKLPFQIKEVRLLTLLFWGYFIAVVFAVIAHPESNKVVGFLSRELYFVLAPFVAIALIKAKFDIAWLALGAKFGLLIIGAIVIYEHFSGVSRPSGFLNANMFANLAVLLFFIVLTISFTEKNKQQVILTTVSLFFGLIAIIYTGGRSAWIAFIILLTVVFYLQLRQRLVKRKIVFFVMPALLVAILLGVFNNTLAQRTSSAYSNVVEWFSGDLTMSSAGQRLEMIRIGIIESPNIPFFGNGYRNINQSIITKKYNHEVHDRIRTYTQLHNAYLTNFVGGGYPLLFALLLNLLVPFLLFKRAVINHKNQLYASIGIVVTIGFSIFGLFNNLFGDVFMNAAYTFCLAILLPKIQSNLDEQRV